MMQIMFDDDHGNRVALECMRLSCVRDDYNGSWAVVCVEDVTERGYIIRADISHAEAREIVRILCETGQYIR